MKPKFKPGLMPFFGNLIPHHIQFEISPLFRQIEKREPESLTVFDVGANRGIWTAAMIDFAAPYINSIHQFEPMPGNIAKIEEHREAGLFDPVTDRVVLNRAAVSDTERPLTIHFDSDVTPFASAVVDKTYRRGKSSVELENSITVDAVTLDGYCERHGIDEIDILKVDVEGFELPALEGCNRMLSQQRVGSLAFEFGTHQLARKDYFEDFWKFFRERGYGMYHLQTMGRPPRPIPEYTVIYEKFDGMTMFLATPQKA